MNGRVEEVFHEVADLDPEARARYFQEHQVNEGIRQEVEALLRFDSGASDFLVKDISTAAAAALPQLEGQGLRCGPYRLLNVIGRGGMGAVYLAERVDGEVTQRVAVKLLPPGAGDLQRERFLQERQILAAISHANIARMLDAGHLDSGQPFLAMEYVEGQPIDVFAGSLGAREKIELFVKVCAAVGYLHRNLVVHRDLKPSNILVTAEGEPKLLDFGISKILYLATDSTMTGLRMLTPDYASPEQVAGGSVSTASDIYSLGAVLYFLLTGKSPHEFKDPTGEGIIAAITTRELTRPSKWRPELKGDLEAILLKAMRKDPQERYATVEQFAEDLEAYLESRPVRARAGNAWYRTRKFLRRYWVPVTAAILVIASLGIGLYLANRERVVAQNRFMELRRLAHIFVFDLHDEVAKLEGSTKTREMMVRTGLQYLDNLSKNAQGDLGLQKEVAEAYMKIGEAQGYPTTPNLGRIDDALASYRKAGDIFRRIAAADSAYLPDLARYYLRYSGLIRFTNDLKHARELSESAIQTFDRLRSRQQFDSQMENSYIAAWCTIGDIDEDMDDYRRAWTEFSHCHDLARAELDKRRTPMELRAVSQAAERVGTAAQELGLLQEALGAFDEDETVIHQLLAREPRNPRFRRSEALLHQFRSRVYYDDVFPDLGDAPRALDSAKRYLEAAEEMAQRDPNNVSAKLSKGVAMYRVSLSLREFDPNAAIEMARESVRIFDGMIASGNKDYLTVSDHAIAVRRLGEAQLKGGQVAEARRSAEAALQAQRQVGSKSPPGSEDRVQLVQSLILAGETSAAAQDFATAGRLLQEARAEAQQIAKRQQLTSLIPLSRVEQALGSLYARRGQVQEARGCYQELVALWQDFPEASEYVQRQRASAAQLLASLH